MLDFSETLAPSRVVNNDGESREKFEVGVFRRWELATETIEIDWVRCGWRIYGDFDGFWDLEIYGEVGVSEKVEGYDGVFEVDELVGGRGGVRVGGIGNVEVV
jgi:hypothetical protein